MSNIICNECETVAHCMKNGCVPKQQALNKMADNARELGLDYEQPAPVAKPHEQEPVAWRYDLKRGGSFEGVSTEYSRVKLSIGENWIPLYTSPPAQRTWVVPDFLTAHDPETPEYRNGWNDCRQLMMEMLRRENT